MSRLLRFISILVSLLLAIVLLVSYLQSWFPPAEMRSLAFLGFVFPYLWITCAVFLLIFILLRRMSAAMIMGLALLVTVCGMSNIINFVPSAQKDVESGKVLKIMTYNVHYFSGDGNGVEIAVKEMGEMFDSVDIVCLQEASAGSMLKKVSKGKSLKELFGFDYEISDHSTKKMPKYGGISQTILSRYPIEIDAPRDDEMDRVVLSSHVDVAGKRVRLINCHLESIKLSPKEIEFVVDSAMHAEIVKDAGSNLRSTYRKMKNAFEARTVQTKYLMELIGQEKGSTIVCGDFNDTPISYTYHTLRGELEDSFSKSFMIWGDTYNGKLPPIRIDYIMHTSDIETKSYMINPKACSDHYAVRAELVIK